MSHRLQDPCRYLKGVGPRRAEALEKLGIRNAGSLLLHPPRQYFDRSQVVSIRELRPDVRACVRVQLESLHARPAWRGRRSVQATVSDDTGQLRVVWYGSYVSEVLQPGRRLMLAGTVVEKRGRLEMHQPEFERIDDGAQELVHAGRIVPLYPLTRGISQKWLRGLMRRTLATHLEAVEEILPPGWLPQLPDRKWAIQALHFPDRQEDADLALQRFKLEELFLLQVLLARRRTRARSGVRGIRMSLDSDLRERYIASLDFSLTAAQQRVLSEIDADLQSGSWMQRLVQGDVGSGKTVVAVAALLLAVGNGYQSVLMAPTEALAMQHAERIMPACAALGVRFGLLSGSRSEREKENLRARMASGDVDLVVGTHALIQEGVRWRKLGLAVVDEQQRFGVLQRGALQQHGEIRPHVIILSATPIPRSLALTLFGDLDVSRLDEKPPGRQPVETHLVAPARRADMWRFVRNALESGNQAFVVLPLIEESEKLDLRAATEEYERLRSGPLAGLPLGLLHGRLPGSEKEELLRDFHAGRLRLLVSTTVVEVGIDVGKATLMIVHHPERFGLSQLHQLRGRVGRAHHKSYCFLLADPRLSREAHARLREFANTDDGFAIAELDLKLRGPGDFLGARQHGLPTLRFADLARDVHLLEEARRAAFALVASDPQLERPENARMRAYLEEHCQERETFAEIG